MAADKLSTAELKLLTEADGFGLFDPERLPIPLAPDRVGFDDRYGPARATTRIPSRPPVHEVVADFEAGAATEDDLLDALVGPCDSSGVHRALAALTSLGGVTNAGGGPRTQAIVDRARSRVIDVAMAQAGTETWAVRAAWSLERSGDLAVFLLGLGRLRRAPLPRGGHGGQSRAAVAARLIATSWPGDDDTPTAFAAAVAALGTPRKRLLELAAFAPQWAEHVELATNLPGLADLAWWWLAHANEDEWACGRDEAERWWISQITSRSHTPVERMVLGTVDADWFHRAVASLPSGELSEIFAAFRAGVTAPGHKRALGFANALGGLEPVDSLIERITLKREQLAVRTLGLAPLPPGDEADDVAARYEILRRFVRERTQFGVQRQASELRAAEDGLANLARTAGHRLPALLCWTYDGIVDPPTQPRDRAWLRRRSVGLLEQLLVDDEQLTGDEVAGLRHHPIAGPLVAALVLSTNRVRGMLSDDGLGLVDRAGRSHAIGRSDHLSIIHPTAFCAPGEREAWADRLAELGIEQAPKQVLREHFLVGPEALSEHGGALHFDGQKVKFAQMRAMLLGRDWRFPEFEKPRRLFPTAGITALLAFDGGHDGSPDGARPTIHDVRFERSTDRSTVAADAVPPAVFSETMRDVALVVAVTTEGATLIEDVDEEHGLSPWTGRDW